MQSELSHHPQTQMAKIQPKKNQKQNRNTLMLLPSVAGVLYLTREFVAHMLLINRVQVAVNTTAGYLLIL